MHDLKQDLLITICARGGSKGVPGKNIRLINGKPLIQHSIDQARAWAEDAPIVVSTDSEEIAEIARASGATLIVQRPAELATDTAPKVPAITHAVRSAEKHFGKKFTLALDLDPTSPLRRREDLDAALQTFKQTGKDVTFSVTHARKNPYFNMVERASDGKLALCKTAGASVVSRQTAPAVYEMNASIYLYKCEFLNTSPNRIWDGTFEIFEMRDESAFDIDEERDFLVVEALMKHYMKNKGPYALV